MRLSPLLRLTVRHEIPTANGKKTLPLPTDTKSAIWTSRPYGRNYGRPVHPDFASAQATRALDWAEMGRKSGEEDRSVGAPQATGRRNRSTQAIIRPRPP